MATKGDKLYYLVISYIIYGIVIGGIYVTDTYIGYTINLIFMVMVLAILSISIISELIERTKVTPLYFYSLCGLLLAALSLIAVFKLEI